MLCDHFHEKRPQRHRQFNAGGDVWHFAPVAEHTNADFIGRGATDTPGHGYT